VNVWIIAGEASGDRYGARLAIELQLARPGIMLAGMGGAQMRAAGVNLLVDSSDLGVVGFVEVLRHLPTFHQVFYTLLREADRQRPDAVVLIDYPGFNLRFARRLRRMGIPVIYYVSPQVWAWGRRRVPRIAEWVDKMLVIFPFEPAVYSGVGLDVEFVGHPLLSILDESVDPDVHRSENEVVLLPGSRTVEIRRILPVMLQTASMLQEQNPDLKFVISLPDRSQAELAEQIRARAARTKRAPENLEISHGRTLYWLQRGAAGLAASGTVTVEAAILGLPLVVTYRVNWITYLLARCVVRVPYITMVNLVLNRLVFEEFIQSQAKPPVLAEALAAILPGGGRRAEVEAGMRELRAALGGGGNASARAAHAILKFLDRRASREPHGDDRTLVLGNAPPDA